MARHFNGSYSVRAGYHGVRKNQPGVSGWFCSQGHWNPSTELVDERASGGFVYQKKVTVCKQCAAQQARALDAATPQSVKTQSDNTPRQ